MCRHSGADVHSHVDVTASREVLPTNVKPIHYDLTLEPDFEKFTYEGSVTIEYVCNRLSWIMLLTIAKSGRC
jgi:aminopeptidase 2